MPSRPDLRELATNVKDAFTDMDRDTLLDILTFVIKEYVVEGPPPMLLHQAETLADLKPASFAQLVTALQARFDFPELAMLVVDGEAVSARVGGVVQPLLAQRTPPPGVQMIDTRPAPAPAPAPVAPVAPPPTPRVQVVETNLSPRPAPPPARGLSIRGRPSDGEMPTPPAAAAPPPAAPPAAAPTPHDKPEPAGGGDDASARFSLLELD